MVFTIDGNIGAGKSTILSILNTRYGIPINLEPIEKWKTFLDTFYNDSIKNTFQFQIRVWLDRCNITTNLDNPNDLSGIERSPIFIKHTFIQAAKDSNLINETDYDLLTELHSTSNKLWTNNVYIYLRSSPQKCLDRIKTRDRSCESSVSLDYITNLHHLHETVAQSVSMVNKQMYICDIEGKSVDEIADEIYLFLFNNYNNKNASRDIKM